MASIDTVVLPNGQQYDIQDYGAYPLWSSFVGIPNTANKAHFAFNYANGATIPDATGRQADDLDTNLDAAGSGLGYAEEMMVYSIMLELPQMPLTQSGEEDETKKLLYDMQVLYEHALFQFKVTKKVYSEGTLGRYPFGGGLWAETNVTDAELVNNGFPAAGAQRPLALPIHLMSEEPFVATLSAPHGTFGTLVNIYDGETRKGYDIRCWLDGIRRRPVA